MDNDNKNESLELTPEEQNAEAEAQKEVNVDELKTKVTEKFGLDPESQGELIDKLVEQEKAHREKLSGAIKQKINYRNKFKEVASKKPDANTSGGKDPNKETPDIDKLVDEKLNARMEQRDLESLGLTDEIQTEVKELAQLKGISVREAAKLPYIVSRVEAVQREERLKKGTPKRSNNGSYVPNVDLTKPLNPQDFDLESEEGRKAWKEAKAARKQAAGDK
jgi:hypothetical protein